MMVCPQCGLTQVGGSVCPRDGARLVPAPTPPGGPSGASFAGPPTAPVWAPPPAKPKSGRLGLIIVIAVVVALILGGGIGWLVATRSHHGTGVANPTQFGPTGPSPTDTNPAPTPAPAPDWTHGLTQLWQRPYTGDPYGWSAVGDLVLASSHLWISPDGNNATGIDPETGDVVWSQDMGADFWGGCTSSLLAGQWACLVPDTTGDSQAVCLLDASTGAPRCLDLTGVLPLPAGGIVHWSKLWFADGGLIAFGLTGSTDPDSHADGTAALRLSLNPLAPVWKTSFDPCGGWGGQDDGVALDRGDELGITGNVLWYRGAWQGDTSATPSAVDIRDGQSLFPAGTCPAIAPLTADSFIVPTAIPAGPINLPGGGSVSLVHLDGGAISYGNTAMSAGMVVPIGVTWPTVPVYYQAGSDGDPGWGYTEGTLALAGGPTWPITLPLQQIPAGAGGSFLNAAVTGHTLVVAAGSGQVVAVDNTSGQVEWSATVLAGQSTTMAVSILGNVAVVSRSDYDLGNLTTLFSLADGQVVWQGQGQAVVSSDATMLAVVSGTDPDLVVTRYQPAG